jgi:hypothetical protein
MGNIPIQLMLKRALFLFGAAMFTAMSIDFGWRWYSENEKGSGAGSWINEVTNESSANGSTSNVDGMSIETANFPSLTSVKNPSKAKAWNGGKSHLDIQIDTELTPTSGDIFNFTFELGAHEECTDLRVGVRGLRGVELALDSGGAGFERQAPCAEGVSGSVQVRIPEGIVGAVVLDVELRTASGEKRKMSKSFEAANKNTSNANGVKTLSLEQIDNKIKVDPSAHLERSGKELVHVIEVK